MSDYFPIQTVQKEFLSSLEENAITILSAPPGSGKSTVLPLWLLDLASAQDKIYLLQPRRLAAKNIACYLSQKIGEPVGGKIGYRLRNEKKVSSQTKLEVITEGVLTQVTQQDPELSSTGIILFDEFHERSSHADLAFALSLEVQQSLRDDLKLVLMSATLSTETLKAALPSAAIIHSEGKSFPVDIKHQPVSQQQSWREHAVKVIKETCYEQLGSILVFLPGAGDIQFLAEKLQNELPDNFHLSTLFGDMTLEDQQKAISVPQTGYKLVLSTNIAETSLTIEGIHCVIDSGLEKVAIFDHQTLTNRLHTQVISKASAVQRAGRAGRLSAGQCIRLYGVEEYQRRLAQPISDILQTDLLPLLIEVARWGVNSLSALPFLEYPDNKVEDNAWQVLQQLEVVDDKRKLTQYGNQVASLACHPRFAHMIVSAQTLEQSHHIKNLTCLACVLTALLEEKDIYTREQAQFDVDISNRINDLIYGKTNGRKFRIIQQAKKLMRDKGVKYEKNLPTDYSGVLLAFAYKERIAMTRNTFGKFLSYSGQGLEVNIEDKLASSSFIVAANVSQLNKKLFVRLAADVSLEQLTQLNGIETTLNTSLSYDEKAQKINAVSQQCLGNIVIKETPNNDQITSEAIAKMWGEQLKKNGISWLPFTKSTLALLSRLRWLNEIQPQLMLPKFDDHALLNSLDIWLMPYVGSITKKAQFAKLNYADMLLSMLDYNQKQLIARMAPKELEGPTGRKYLIHYGKNKSPKISLPMQAVYGQPISPQVGDVENGLGIPLILELLSPAGRPIQVTQDLAQFWQGSYREVQKEMKGKYPKHFWPDDPAHATATTKTKKYM